jgi:hypothetical protein
MSFSPACSKISSPALTLSQAEPPQAARGCHARLTFSLSYSKKRGKVTPALFAEI